MEFNEKLDFLMNITKTSNSSLAHYLSLDASYISRLRSGKRQLPSNTNYVDKMASYFAKYLDKCQTNNLLKILEGKGFKQGDRYSVEETLNYWLTNDANNIENVESFIDEYLYFQLNNHSDTVSQDKFTHKCNDKFQVYYGAEGKRKAVLKFLNYVIDEKYPQTLYLFSDENMDWLREDPKFLNEWASLMFQVFKQGNKINIIHTVTRNLDEMLIAIKGWMPFYFTGAIESYYYPKKRDGIFQRTLFIAPKTVAIESTSVGDMVEDAPNISTYDNKAIQGFKKEYMNYLSLCKPLIQVYGANMKWQYYKNITEFESKVADSIIKSNGLSILTMPESLIESIVKRVSNENAENVINIYKSRVDYIKKNIENNIYIEILSIPTIDQVLNGEVRVKLSSFTVAEDVFYSIDEYKLHLENIINLLTSLDNYHLHLYEEKSSQDYSFYIKEGIGMFMWSQSNPNVAIKVEENNIVAAFWDYIKFELNIDQIEVKNKIKTIDRLKNIINEL